MLQILWFPLEKGGKKSDCSVTRHSKRPMQHSLECSPRVTSLMSVWDRLRMQFCQVKDALLCAAHAGLATGSPIASSASKSLILAQFSAKHQCNINDEGALSGGFCRVAWAGTKLRLHRKILSSIHGVFQATCRRGDFNLQKVMR